MLLWSVKLLIEFGLISGVGLSSETASLPTTEMTAPLYASHQELKKAVKIAKQKTPDWEQIEAALAASEKRLQELKTAAAEMQALEYQAVMLEVLEPAKAAPEILEN